MKLISLLICLALANSCTHTPTPPPAPEPTPTQQPEPQQLIDEFSDEDIFHLGYEVRRLMKKVNYEYEDEHGNTKSSPIEVSYAVIKRNRKAVAEFDGPFFGEGNSTKFGLFDFLGDRSQQVIISTTVFRGGRHWVVSLHPEFRVLFDSADYQVGREDFYVIDLDHDGVYEISLEETAFYDMVDLMYTGEIPLPEIIFRYDAAQKKYLPSNALFPDYAMRGLPDELRGLDDERRYFSNRLRILLRYIYAGKEKEGWAFFDGAYSLADKEKMKARIRCVLNDDPLYKYLHQSK